MPTTTINLTGQALSKVDDTNVTLTLGGTPLTALLKATSITVGWTGTLADARITSAATWNAKESALTFSTGLTRTVNTITIDSSVVTLTGAQALSNKTGLISQWTNDSGYLTSLSGAVTSVSGTLNRITSTGGATPAIDISATFEALLGKVANPLSQFAATTSLQLLGVISDETGTGSLVFANTPTLVTPVIGAATGTSLVLTGGLTSGVASSAAGTLVLRNATNAFTQTIRGTNPVASITYDLPTTAPTAGQVLQSTAPSAGVATLSWATAASGLTVGTTTITSGTTGSIGMNIGGIYSESISYRAQQATPFSTAFGFESHSSASFSGVHNSSFGYRAGKSITTGTYNTAFGSESSQVTTGSYNSFFGHEAGFSSNVTGSQNTGIGTYSCYGLSSGQYNTAVGYQSLAQTNVTGTTAAGYDAGRLSGSSYSIFIGYTAGSAASSNSCIIIGYGAVSTTATNQGILGSNNANGYISDWYFNGVTHTAAYSTTLNASGGSGTNNTGASLTLSGGKSTGSAAGGSLLFKTSTTLGSGTTAQSLVTRLTISGGAVTTGASTATWADALDFVFGSTTGTKIGTATTQKLSFWNATPIVQPTTAVATSPYTHVPSTAVHDDSTFDGYKLGQVVKALRELGILA